MLRLIAALFAIALVAVPAGAPVLAGPDGLIMKRSNYSVGETLDRLAAALDAKGVTVFARIDHAANAERAGLSLRPAQVLIFGNPKLGTPLMRSNAVIAIDLPQKALAFQDGEGGVWLAYNDPQYLADRHDVDDRPKIIAKIGHALDAFTDTATQ